MRKVDAYINGKLYKAYEVDPKLRHLQLSFCEKTEVGPFPVNRPEVRGKSFLALIDQNVDGEFTARFWDDELIWSDREERVYYKPILAGTEVKPKY